MNYDGTGAMTQITIPFLTCHLLFVNNSILQPSLPNMFHRVKRIAYDLLEASKVSGCQLHRFDHDSPTAGRERERESLHGVGMYWTSGKICMR